MEDFLNTSILSNTVNDYVLAIATFIIALIVIYLIKSVVMSRLKKWARHTQTRLDDRLLSLIEQPTLLVLCLGSFYIAIDNLILHPIFRQSINVVCVITGTILTIQFLGSLVEYGTRLYLLKQRAEPATEQTLSALVPAIKVVVWAIGIVFLLDNLGFDISAVVTSLGIGGVAVALAAQGILGDLFSYVSILFDRPFELGDFIVVGDMMGTVEHIGIKTTRLQSLTGEELVIGNTDITASRIQNFKRMARRRVVFNLGVTYTTTTTQMKQIPDIIQKIVEDVESVSFVRAHFASYGDFSLNYEIVYYVETNDYAVYMDVQQSIYLAIKESFEAEAIEFAYPTQMLYVDTLAAENQSQHSSANSL